MAIKTWKLSIAFSQLLISPVTLARRLLDCRGAGGDLQVLEHEINRRGFGLFGLSGDEVEIIRGGEG